MTDTADLIRAVEQADTPPRLLAAVKTLAKAQDEAGIPTLIAVLGYNNPVAAEIAIDGLIQLGSASVQPLITLLDEYNYGARAYSIRALAAIADPRALDVLLAAAATDFAPSVRRAAAKGLGGLHWDLLDSSLRSTAQTKAIETLTSIAQDADWSIRYAAIVGLQGLAGVPDLRESIASVFAQIAAADTDAAVKARVALATQMISPS
ncbi:HEAT repeat domain-containing protein [Microcoleus sp. FACHB-1515]|uniref:HEAT repeat domain-containing protein n=1 Tax=Cyanophyceae TaxID=3028117 RepID=UPI001688B9EA|nr:HEAT repeat domain-containing protein [Microcoleus sp. FACHB-1515]MBD2088515.1 HEAT repeat domain-containing protein [Microcoleus sp. FACHB-1515]